MVLSTHTLIVPFQERWTYIKQAYMFFFQQAYMWYRSQWWSHSWSGQKQSQLVNSPNSLPKWMSDLWTMQNQSTVQDLKKNTFFQSWEWCGGLADPTHKCPALSINRNQPAQPQLLECRAFEDKKRSSAKDTEDAVDGPGLLGTKGLIEHDSFKAQNHWFAMKYLANTLHYMLNQIIRYTLWKELGNHFVRLCVALFLYMSTKQTCKFFPERSAEEKRIQFRKPYSEARVAQSPS